MNLPEKMFPSQSTIKITVNGVNIFITTPNVSKQPTENKLSGAAFTGPGDYVPPPLYPIGTTCRLDRQCQSKNCHSVSSAIGVCAAPNCKTEGAQCAYDSDCCSNGFQLTCNNDKVCEKWNGGSIVTNNLS